jgi:hypothetical protein
MSDEYSNTSEMWPYQRWTKRQSTWRLGGYIQLPPQQLNAGWNRCYDEMQAEIERLRSIIKVAAVQEWSELQNAWAEIERLRAALEICAKATWFDDDDLEFRLTEEAKVARAALYGETAETGK